MKNLEKNTEIKRNYQNSYKDGVLLKRFNLKQLDTKFKKYDIASFDIETCGGHRNDFYLFGYIDPYNEYHYTFDKLEAINILNKIKHRGILIYATNLHFDFNSISEGTDLKNKCDFTIRGNSYISIKWRGTYNKIILRDTMNYGGYSVETMGKILKLPKLKKPKCFGRKAKNEKELKELLEYNKRDCEVSKKFMEMMQQTINNLGGELKATISSCAMDLFRRKFLDYDVVKESFFIDYVNIKQKIFKAYYGGRTEAFKRGLIDKTTSRSNEWFYGDVNSLYPSVMLNEFPDPMSVQYYKHQALELLKYEGVSYFELKVPYQKYPLLPYRMEDKLLFPYGNLKGYYTHLEIREAIKQGTIIVSMSDTVYYKRTRAYFKRYVNTLYALRKQLKSEGSEIETAIKLLLNSLYGRFALKNISRTVFFNMDTIKNTKKHIDKCEAKGLKIQISSSNEGYYNEPDEYDGIASIPIWSIYTTAYARLKLHSYIIEFEPVYVDTDSIITDKKVLDSKILGELKLEKMIKFGIIIKPKLYFPDDEIKSKGIPIPKDENKAIRYKKINKLKRKILDQQDINYKKFIKIKEGIRRNIKVNSIIIMTKHINLEDTKRKWNGRFNEYILQDSEPIEIL